MKLNPDCIRDILISLENIVDLNISLTIDETNSCELCDKYLPNQVLYHLNQCIESGLLKGSNRGSYILIIDITPAGHNFLANIHDEENWNGIKKIAVGVGSFSLDALKQIAIGYITSKITSQF